jgi:RNA polymerase sigma factor (TIGR02999 family)
MAERAITGLIDAWRGGDVSARDRLSTLVYAQLHAMAEQRCGPGAASATLQPTALVHEALLHLWQAPDRPRNRAHLFALAALQMRSILVDYARARSASKRGGDALRVTLDPASEQMVAAETGFLELEDALLALEREDPRSAEAVTLNYFGGLNQEDIAEVQAVSLSTVERSLRFGRAWLKRALTP